MIVTLESGRKLDTSVLNCTGYIADSIELELHDYNTLRKMSDGKRNCLLKQLWSRLRVNRAPNSGQCTCSSWVPHHLADCPSYAAWAERIRAKFITPYPQAAIDALAKGKSKYRLSWLRGTTPFREPPSNHNTAYDAWIAGILRHNMTAPPNWAQDSVRTYRAQQSHQDIVSQWHANHNKEKPMKISFSIPLHRFDDNDHLATRASLCQAFGVEEHHIDRMITDAKQHQQFTLNFLVSPEQFAMFLIRRNDLGSKNMFAELKPAITGDDQGGHNRRIIDFTNTLIPGARFRLRPEFDTMASRSVHASVAEGYAKATGKPMERVFQPKRPWPTPDVYRVAADPTSTSDIGVKSDGTVRSRFDLEFRRFPSGSFSFNFLKSSACEQGTVIHEAIAAVTDDLNKKHSEQMTRVEVENSNLRRLLHNAASKLSSVIFRIDHPQFRPLDSRWAEKTRLFIKTLWTA